jgi:hypothetical protein
MSIYLFLHSFSPQSQADVSGSLLPHICKSSENDAFFVARELIQQCMNVNEGYPLHIAVLNKCAPLTLFFFPPLIPLSPPCLPSPFFFLTHICFLFFLFVFNLGSCVNMVWLLVLSGANTNMKDEETNMSSWELCENEDVHRALCRSWTVRDFKWFPFELKASIVR